MVTGPPGYDLGSVHPYNAGETGMGGARVGKQQQTMTPVVEKMSEREGAAAGTQELDSAPVAGASRESERYELP